MQKQRNRYEKCIKETKKRRKAAADVAAVEISLADFVREELRELVIAQGMLAVQKLLEEDRDRLCGAAYERCERTARRAGSAPGELVLGGRKVRVKRPRVHDAEGGVSWAGVSITRRLLH